MNTIKKEEGLPSEELSGKPISSTPGWANKLTSSELSGATTLHQNNLGLSFSIFNHRYECGWRNARDVL
jgi:hypothetical protein